MGQDYGVRDPKLEYVPDNQIHDRHHPGLTISNDPEIEWGQVLVPLKSMEALTLTSKKSGFGLIFISFFFSFFLNTSFVLIHCLNLRLFNYSELFFRNDTVHSTLIVQFNIFDALSKRKLLSEEIYMYRKTCKQFINNKTPDFPHLKTRLEEWKSRTKKRLRVQFLKST